MTEELEMSKQVKDVAAEVSAPSVGGRNFRAAADIESFYRFIYENNLRDEARVLLKNIHTKLHKGHRKKNKNLH